ncbi:MAG: helicase [Desulfohalobiaceae bacterium]|nr:helicase [Desulfohalobiaceae bacterium]
MTAEFSRADVKRILDGLKAFQRRTVDYVYHRLYEAPDSTNRFLVADEVGLGKTLVARGVIARAIECMQHEVERFDVVYICSNADLARQNIARLNVTGRRDISHASRITMLPLVLNNLDQRLNFISFTPGTSFEMKSDTGIAEERALLYWLLKGCWGFSGDACLRVFQCGVHRLDSFKSLVFSPIKEAAEASQAKPLLASFYRDLLACDEECEREGRPGLRHRFQDLVAGFTGAQDGVPSELNQARNRFIGEIRRLLARSCLISLEPDLVILDEFQRFRHLLGDQTEAGQLARQLFSYSDENTDVRVLLLSATPYKMYTVYGEEEDHYRDFRHTLSFLLNDHRRMSRVEKHIADYRSGIYDLDGDDNGRLLQFRRTLEKELLRVMCRTERLSVSSLCPDMVQEMDQSESMHLEEQDILSLLDLQRISQLLDAGDMTEYWKSAPYLLNFMEQYKLKQQFEKVLDQGDPSLVKAFAANNGEQLHWERIQRYEALSPANAKLRTLLKQTLDQGTWKMLWMPPALPYYQLTGPFENQSHCTKTLIFSCWKVVPKAVASMFSYLAEQRIFQTAGTDFAYRPSSGRRGSRLLEFSKRNERLTGMPVLGLVYPSFSLARLGDPVSLAGEHENGGLSLKSLLKRVKTKLEPYVERIVEKMGAVSGETGQGQRADEAWYWAAPLLLDRLFDPDKACDWLRQEHLSGKWRGFDHEEEEEEDGGGYWEDHVQYAREMIQLEGGGRNGSAIDVALGRPPEDLLDVLALLAVAGPANACLRALVHLRPHAETVRFKDDHLRILAGQAAFGFRSLFNQPETIGIIRGLHPGEPYWRKVLEYSASGCIQAVLDEYLHFLDDHLGLSLRPVNEAREGVAGALRLALTLRTTRSRFEEIKQDDGQLRLEPHRLRNHIALAYGEQKSYGNDTPTRETDVRQAFNSPFWPHVLVTTSIGQEGLDFHAYCHRVVHWNLPSNPVDLEQREGRVHRYKGHALRKNLAASLGHEAILDGASVWPRLFELAERQSGELSSGLIPYWVASGPHKIERHVFSLPLSRDIGQHRALRRSLAVYRMVFGQPRQEDLMEWLLARLGEKEREHLMQSMLIDLRPRSTL